MSHSGPQAHEDRPTPRDEPPLGPVAPYHPAGLVPPNQVRVMALLVAGLPLAIVIVVAILIDNALGGGGGGGGIGSAPGLDDADFLERTAPSSVVAWTTTAPWQTPTSRPTAVTPFHGASASLIPSTDLTYSPTYSFSSSPSFSRVPTTTPSPGDPAGTVLAYFAAINRGDYMTAWNLGGRNLDRSYDDFVASFRGTASDTVTVLSVQGDVVAVTLDAVQTDGTRQSYSGTYTVQAGAIVKAAMKQTS